VRFRLEFFLFDVLSWDKPLLTSNPEIETLKFIDLRSGPADFSESLNGLKSDYYLFNYKLKAPLELRGIGFSFWFGLFPDLAEFAEAYLLVSLTASGLRLSGTTTAYTAAFFILYFFIFASSAAFSISINFIRFSSSFCSLMASFCFAILIFVNLLQW